MNNSQTYDYNIFLSEICRSVYKLHISFIYINLISNLIIQHWWDFKRVFAWKSFEKYMYCAKKYKWFKSQFSCLQFTKKHVQIRIAFIYWYICTFIQKSQNDSITKNSVYHLFCISNWNKNIWSNLLVQIRLKWFADAKRFMIITPSTRRRPCV